MKSFIGWGLVLGLVGMCGLEARAAELQADANVTGEPVRYSFVEGDDEKFSAHHWVKENYAGGVSDVSVDSKLWDGWQVSTGGHALIDENDLSGNFLLKKDSIGYFLLDYDEFRKYYDGTGGVYYRFETLKVNETDKVLALNIGHLRLETGLMLEDLPKVTLAYEREFKDGAKSRLTWTAVREGIVTRNIGPAWQDIDEVVDIFEIKADHEMAGFNLNGEQRWEFVRTQTSREEKSLSTEAIPANHKIRVQDQEPETNLMTTTGGIERWFFDERAFASAGYRFAHMRNREIESLFEFDENRNPRNFSNPKQIRGARADNDFDTHTWVANVMLIPWKWLDVITKLKSEVMNREGSSIYPSDTTPAIPDGIINTTERSQNDSRALRWGQGVSLRFRAIPRTALYSDLELEEIRSWLSEDRTSIAGQSPANPNEIFNRETITQILRGTWTLGCHVSPWSGMHVTAHFRQRHNRNDYDDKHETAPGLTAARSAFFDALNILTNELAIRVALKPVRWFQPSFRYQLRTDNFNSRIEDQPTVATDTNSHIFTFDLSLQPHPNLLTMLSFSRQLARTVTPAASSSVANTPAFEANVDTWLLDVEYVVRPNLVLTSALEYSRAENFNDFTAVGLPMGTDFDRVDLTVGFNWNLGKYVSLEPKYAFFYYRSNPHAEFGDYFAHVFWLELSLHGRAPS